MKTQAFILGMCLIKLVLLLLTAAKPCSHVVDKLTVREFEQVYKNGMNRILIKT